MILEHHVVREKTEDKIVNLSKYPELLFDGIDFKKFFKKYDIKTLIIDLNIDDQPSNIKRIYYKIWNHR